MRIKYGKITIAVLITVLIWVWADMAKTEELSVSNAAITVAKSTNPNLWVSFNDKSSVSVNKIVLRGSTSRIDRVKRKLRDGSLSLEFFYDPEPQALTRPEYLLNVFDFLRRSDQIKRLGLTVESCKPETLSVRVVKLVERSLAVECLGESGTSLKPESIEPSKVDAFVPESWSGNQLLAYVLLGRVEEQQARRSVITKTPYVVLSTGQTRDVAEPVKIKLPRTEEGLQEHNITSTIGYIFSANLAGKYRVDLLNPSDMATVVIKATTAAKQAYESMPYKLILEIYDGDARSVESTEPIRRNLIYNFPAEYLRNGEIEPKSQQPITARFKLFPLSAETP